LSFNELGVSLAIVRWPGDPKRIAATVATISTVSSLIFTLAAFAAAPAFTALMGAPEATSVVQVLTFNVFIGGLVATPAALLQRNFNEKARTGIDQVNVWIGAVLSAGLALAGMGAMSLAIGRLAGAAVSGALFVLYSPLPFRFGWNREHVPALLRFGWPLAGTSIVLFLVGYADQIIGGHVLGATTLGFYALAFNLASWPLGLVSQPLRRVAPAAFSSLQADPERMKQTMNSLVGLVAVATLPAFLALAGAARPVVVFVYGHEWLPAAAALSWLVVAAACRVFQELIYDYLVVLGRTAAIFRIQITSLTILIPTLLAGAHIGGLAGIAMAQAGVAVIVTLPLYLRQLRQADLKLRGLFQSALAGLAVGLACGFASWAFSRMSIPGLGAIALAGGCAILASGLLLWFRRKELVRLRSIGDFTEVEAAS